MVILVVGLAVLLAMPIYAGMYIATFRNPLIWYLKEL